MNKANKIFLLFSCCMIFLFKPASSQDYFQQKTDYTIRVSLDDKKHQLNGEEVITYTNNSPDSLPEIYFHPWPNAYKNDETALADQFSRMGSNKMTAATSADLGYIDGMSFRSEGKALDWEYLEDTIDVCVIHLKKPLQPSGTIILSTSFRVQVPAADLSRMGHDGQAYYITQWYPKPAVYDASGWNYFPYLDQGEFYSEFGTFDVYLTLPKNYVVGIRTPWTLSSDYVWERTHRFAAPLCFVVGVSLSGYCLVRQESLNFLIIGAIIAVTLLAPYCYSYVTWKRTLAADAT
jgi:hypothetical protein